MSADTIDALAARLVALGHDVEVHGWRIWVDGLAWAWLDRGRYCVDDGNNVHACRNLGLAMAVVRRIEG